MSHYTRVATKITRRSALVKALIKLGFKEHMIEQSDTAMQLRGYQGDGRAQKAHVRIKGSGWSSQNYVGGASNDLGFEQVEDGSYVFHVSDYDRHRYGTNWQEKLFDEYSRAVIHEEVETMGFFIEEERTEENGEIYIRVESPF